MEDRAAARDRKGTLRHQARGCVVGRERFLELAGERGHVPAPEGGLVLLEQALAHVAEPTASSAAPAPAGGTGQLPLGVLRRLARALEAVLLALLHPRVPREQSGLAKDEAMLGL